MNKQSSRSHAIFTITLEQRRLVSTPEQGGAGGDEDDDDDEDDEGEAPGDGGEDNSYLCAKMHLVDLAGRCSTRCLPHCPGQGAAGDRS